METVPESGLSPEDFQYMGDAVRLARLGLGYTTPNPPVGAVIVRDHQIIGYGYHFRAGSPHAERWALKRAGKKARDATLYVTLEPCNHHGRTPPCTEAIIQAGIRRVVFGCLDPNTEVTGGGAQRLRDAGLEVVHPARAEECARLIQGFIRVHRRKRPYTILKVAMTLDGKVGSPGRRLVISSGASRDWVQHLRATCDAVMVGAGTVITDRPELVPRTEFLHDQKPYIRCILDSRLRTPPDAPCYDERSPVIIFHAVDVRPEPVFHRGHITLVPIPTAPGGLDLERVLHHLADHDIQRLLVEPGPILLKSFLQRPDLFDEFWLIHSTKSLDEAPYRDLTETAASVWPRLRFHREECWIFEDDTICRMTPVFNP